MSTYASHIHWARTGARTWKAYWLRVQQEGRFRGACKRSAGDQQMAYVVRRVSGRFFFTMDYHGPKRAWVDAGHSWEALQEAVEAALTANEALARLGAFETLFDVRTAIYIDSLCPACPPEAAEWAKKQAR